MLLQSSHLRETMTKTMLCGAGSFSPVDEDPSLPALRGSRRKHGSSNPYSTRGLDKFSMVLADLESRREKIMAQTEGASLVRFVYSSSNEWVPIVVRPREQRPELEKPMKGAAAAEAQKEPAAAVEEHPAPPPPAEQTDDNNRPAREEPVRNRALKKSFSGKAAGGREGRGFFRWKPSYHWPALVVLILLCLVLGRAFAICCTSMWWYWVPCMTDDESHNVRNPMKKGCRRRTSDEKLGAGGGDAAVTHAPAKVGDSVGSASPRQHRTRSTGPC